MILISLLSLLPRLSRVLSSFLFPSSTKRSSAPCRLSVLFPLLSHFLLRAFTFTRRRREDLAAKPSFLEAHLDFCFKKINLVQVIYGLLVAD